MSLYYDLCMIFTLLLIDWYFFFLFLNLWDQKERERYEYIVVDGKLINRLSGEVLNTQTEGGWEAGMLFVISTCKRLYVGEVRKFYFILIFQHNFEDPNVLSFSFLFLKLFNFIISTWKNTYGFNYNFFFFFFFVPQKRRGKFHHSSFLAGGATIGAGTLVAEDGILKVLYLYIY